jgi:hypothetical protein
VKNLFLVGAIVAFIGTWSIECRAGTLVARESQWSAWPGDQPPSDELLDWVDPGFNDSDWQSSAAPFRYGDGAGGTLINGMQNTYSTFFLRRHFSVASVAQIEGIDLNMDYDDGFAVWLNGVEVLRVNAPETLSLNGFAPVGHESGSFESFSLNDAILHLVEGDNVIAIQGFNINLGSSDFMLHPELTFVGLDTQSPTVVAVEPPPGLVPAFSQVSITFSEPVVGVEASDLALNGNSALRVTGSGDTYLFTFANPEPGELTLRWQQDVGIVDLAANPNEFNWQEPTEVRLYQLIDLDAPFVSRIFPLPDQTLSEFSEVDIIFSEPISGIEASDLLANGEPAISVLGAGAGPYTFSFKRQQTGTQSLEWSSTHGIEDFASEPNELQTGQWQYEVSSETTYQGVVLSEILSGNQSGLLDDDRERVDWIELHNTNDFEVDLSGWSLSDDPNEPGKWTFGEHTIEANGYLVVFASAKDRLNRRTGAPPHTNFRLSRTGEFLGLFSPELPRHLVSDLRDRYPEQRNDHSYGRFDTDGLSYFSTPTPGLPNSEDLISEILPNPSFSASRGYYDQPFQLVLSSVEPDAVVRYTTDKSEPTLENGVTFTEPIALSRSAVVRAAVFKTGLLPSETITHSYLFRLSNARRSLPILSLVTDQDHLFGPQGIMETSPRNTVNRGRAWERPVSVEYFLPDGVAAFQIDCGLRLQGGNYVRGRYDPNAGLPFSKYSYRLYFRGDYGESALTYPLIPRSPAKEYKQIVLRAGMNDHSDPYVVDELVRRLSADMGQVSSQGTLVNLFVNGVYKGYYNPTERIDEDFLDTWQGGQGDYDIIAQFGEVRAGDTLEWNRLTQALRRDLSVAANYEQASQMLHIDSFIDYLILNVYVGTRDWPHNNWRAARERVQGAQWRFYVWDAEWSFFNQGGSVRHNTLTNELAVNQDIARFYQALAQNNEFRTRFADRVHQHFFDDGALTDENILNRFQELRGEISDVRNISNTIATSWIPQRRENVFSHLADEGLFLEDNIPSFSEPVGSVRVSSLSLTTGGGEIYYTLDGTDPFLPEVISSLRNELVTDRAIKYAFVPIDNSLGSRWRSFDPDFDTTNWLRGRGGVGYDQAQTYNDHIGINVDASMNDKNTSTYVRIPFNVSLNVLEGRNLMNLRVKYDDGFVAYLNGRRIASANAPTTLQWNASANGDNPDASAVNFQTFKVSDQMHLLREGDNVLAFQGLNVQLSSSDFLLDALLEIGVSESGKVADGAILYEGPIPIDSVIDVRARSLSNGLWSALSSGVFYPGGLTSDLKLTEIMYHPPGGDAFEFVEVTNLGPVRVDLSRYEFRGISFSFAPESFLEPGGTLLLASDQNPSAFQLRYPSVSVWGYFAGSLSNSGESLVLEDAIGKYVTGVYFEDQGAWAPSADGEGYSLEFQYAGGDNADPANWWQSQGIGGSPGIYLSEDKPEGLVINEIVAANRTIEKAGGLFPDWIELENRSNSTLNLKGYRLRDESGRSDYVFNQDTELQPMQRMVVWQSLAGSDGNEFSFGLDREGDTVVLLNPQGSRVDAVSFGRQLFDYSLSRGESNHWFLGEPSPGAPNMTAGTASLVDSLRINEIMANPLPGEDDWLELLNLNATLPLSLDGLHFRFNEHVVGLSPNSFLEAGGIGVLFANDAARRESLRFRISSLGGQLDLLDARGNLIDQVSFRLQAEGASLGRLPNGTGGFRVFSNQATPGQENALRDLSTIVINEIMARNQSVAYAGVGGTPDWIELANITDNAVDVGGMSLRLDGGDEWALPVGTQISGKGLLVVWFDGNDLVQRGMFPGFIMNRSLPASGGAIELLDGEGRLIDQIRYGIQIADQSIGRQGEQWALLTRGTPGEANANAITLGSVNDLRINEWSGAGEGGDWLELYHRGSLPVSLGGLFLTDDPSLAGKTKHPIAHLSFVGPKSWIAFNADGETQQGSDHLNFRLSARGETLRIYSESLNVIDEILVAQSSIEGGSSGRLPDGMDRIVSFGVHESSTGRPNHQIMEGLRLNEVLLTPQVPLERAIELYNVGPASINISGWAIGSERSSLDAFRVPSGSVVESGQYYVLHETSWLPSMMAQSSDWHLSNADRLYLSELDGQGVPTGRRVSILVSPTHWNESFGGIDLNHGLLSERLHSPTFGASIFGTPEEFQLGAGALNSLPWLGPVIVTELLIDSEPMVEPLPAPLIGIEYVELLNRSNETILLSSSLDPVVGWRLAGGIDFTFESDVTLDAGQVLLVVNFDPKTEPLKTLALQQAWSLPLDVQVTGPFDGRLDNNGDRVRLQRLAFLPNPIVGMGAETLAWIDEDHLDYSSQSPWPILPQTDIVGLSRLNKNAFGNDPVNWGFAIPSPGLHGAGVGPNQPLGPIQSLSLVDGQIILQVATENGVDYKIQYANTLNAPVWIDLEQLNGTGDVWEIVDSSPLGDARFYRVVFE